MYLYYLEKQIILKKWIEYFGPYKYTYSIYSVVLKSIQDDFDAFAKKKTEYACQLRLEPVLTCY